MKNKEFQKLLKNRDKSNSGFTLTELLVGLIMGTIVVGGLGFGLVHLLRNTQTSTAFSEARNNSSRALDFISDEVKRAVSIQNDATNATGFTTNASKTVVFALDIPQLNTSATLGSDASAATPERVVYFLQDATTSDPWQGPQVLYRYGPPLDANGNYTTGSWGEEALIDGIDDTTLATGAIQCDTNPVSAGGQGQIISPASPTGFYTCIQDDNLNGVVENDATADTNGDGEINELDDDDTDNIGISAQLFLTSAVDIGKTDDETYTANTQIVARARVAPANNSGNFVSYTMSYRTLGAVYNCHPQDSSTWSMRTDFGNDPTNPDNTVAWVHQENRQPQPITIDTTNDLTINTTPVQPTRADCLSLGDETATTATGGEPISEFSDGTRVDGHTIEFPMKFVVPGDSSTANNWHTFNGDPKTGTRDEPDVKGDGTILMLKRGSVINDSLTGYDFNQDSTQDQDSLGEFLLDKGYADKVGSTYVINNKLQADERIMAVEVGQTDPTHPGWDIQDSVIILSSDVFAEKYGASGAGGAGATGSGDTDAGTDS